ncbi:MAG TPA: hypothetical protein VGI10_12030 [Polyangiaceae bacterium]|jgi:hypothetical protein
MRPLSRFAGFVAVALLAPSAFGQSAQESPPPAPSSLGDSAELARVVGLYDGGRYAECANALHELLRPDGPRPLKDPDVVQSARVYQAACLIGSGQPDLADAPLKAAIHDNPQMKPPDSLVFPPAVVERFLRVREASLADIRHFEAERIKKAQAAAAELEKLARKERERVAALERLARQETIVVENRRAFALVPFGVGQFQNDSDALGWLFLSSETLLAAGALTTLGVYTHQIQDAEDKRGKGIALAPGANAQLTNWRSAAAYTSLAFFAVSLIGVGQAELAYVPGHREVREHKLPKELEPQAGAVRIWPDALIGKQGALFGLSGTF